MADIVSPSHRETRPPRQRFTTALIVGQVVPSDAGNVHFLRVCLNCLNILQQIFPAAKDQLASLIDELYAKIKSVVEEKELRDILSDNVSRGLLINLVSKYNIFTHYSTAALTIPLNLV